MSLNIYLSDVKHLLPHVILSVTKDLDQQRRDASRPFSMTKNTTTIFIYNLIRKNIA